MVFVYGTNAADTTQGTGWDDIHWVGWHTNVPAEVVSESSSTSGEGVEVTG